MDGVHEMRRAGLETHESRRGSVGSVVMGFGTQSVACVMVLDPIIINAECNNCETQFNLGAVLTRRKDRCSER